jgi:hypothetical protein
MNMKRHLIMVSALLLVLPAFLFAQDKSHPGEKAGSLWKGAGTPFQNVMDINNISIWAKADGWHPNVHNGVAAGTYPKGTNGWGWAAGWLFGGKVNDGGTQTVRVGGCLDRPGLQAGKILTDASGHVTGREDPSAADVRVFRVRPDWETADLTDDAAYFYDKSKSQVTDADIAAIRTQYETDWDEWPASKGAPYQDVNGNGSYDSGTDVPGIPGADQTLWLAANDLSEEQTTQFYGSIPTGIEFQLCLWAYASSTPLNDVVFYQAKWIYKGTATTPAGSTIDSMYVAYWADPDLGDYTDDFVGCDTVLNLGFAWNSSAVDRDFRALGLPPPSFGWDFLNGTSRRTGDPNDSAIVDLQWRKGYKYVLDKSFAGFIRGAAGVQDPPYPGGQYTQTLQWYNAMRGFQPTPAYPQGVPYTDPSTGVTTRYTVAGDPVRGTGWIDGLDIPPGDRRLSMVNGPFTLSLGDTAGIVLAMVGGMGADNLSSITVMKYNDNFAQFAFDNLFVLPKPPSPPKVEVAQLHNEAVLSWGDPTQVNLTENTPSQGFEFEGYNVYQFPTPASTVKDAQKIATYDVVNNVATIVDQSVDPSSGVIITVPSEVGRNSGVQRYIKLTKDAFSGKPLTDGRPYYYAVTAYSYNGSQEVPFHALESAPVILTVTPQSPKPGTRYLSTSGDTLTVTHTGTTEGSVIPIVVDPTKVTGHTYNVNFTLLSDGSTTWTLTDATTGQAKVTGQTNQSGDDNYPIVDGLLVKVMGPTTPGMAGYTIPNGTREWSSAGANWGTEGFGGAMGMAFNSWYSSSTIGPDKLHNVLIKFGTAAAPWDPNSPPSDANYSYGYRYLRNATAAPANSSFAPFIVNATAGYAYQDFKVNVPFSAWDQETDPPTRLAVGFLENNVAAGFVDGVYFPGNSDVTDNVTSREFFFIFATPYSTTPDPTYQVNILSETVPMMWYGTPNRRTSNTFHSGDEFLILASHINTPAVTFTFTAPTIESTPELAKDDVSLINVFPNPYLGYNELETTRISKFMTFSHLPQRATIRIYTLGAMLVKTIVKDDASQFTAWDLRNQNNLPVASGIYIAHIELPDLGASKVLKLAIVQEDQFLRIY